MPKLQFLSRYLHDLAQRVVEQLESKTANPNPLITACRRIDERLDKLAALRVSAA
jgi:hypothetical protein